MASTPPSRTPTRAAFSLATPYSNELPGTHPPSVRGRFLEQGWPAWTFWRFERGAPPPEEEDEEEGPRGTAAGSATFHRTTKEARCDFHEDRKGSPTAGSMATDHWTCIVAGRLGVRATLICLYSSHAFNSSSAVTASFIRLQKVDTRPINSPASEG